MSNSRRINLQKYVFNDIDIGNKKELEKIFLFEISKGNFEVVNELLFLGLDLNCVDGYGSNALHHSAYNNNVEALKFLTNKNINLNQINNYGHSALFTSVISKSHNAYEFLINKFDTFQIDKEGYSLLHYALINEDYKIVKDLIENYGFDLNLIDKSNCNLLHYCSKHSNTDILEFILNKNENLLESVNDKSRTPLFEAAFNKNGKVTKLLLDKGSKFDINNIIHVEMLTEIIFGSKYKNIIDAIKNNDIKAIEFFKHNGVDINSVDKQNNSLLIVSCMYSKPETILYLINNEVDINLHNNLGFTPLMYASKRGDIKTIYSFLTQKVNLNQKTKDGLSALIIAAENNNKEIVQLLIEKGALFDINDKNQVRILTKNLFFNGYETIIDAVINNDLKAIKFFLDNDIDIDFSDKLGNTTLLVATEKSNIETIKFLVYAKANVNVVNNKNYTPLMFAVERGFFEIVDLLIGFGSNVDATNNEDETALMIATTSGREEIVKLLIKKGVDVNKVNVEKHNALIYAAILGYNNIFNMLYPKTENKLFKKIINTIHLSGHNNIQFEINKVKLDQLGAVLSYTTSFKDHINWEYNIEEIKSILGLQDIELINEHDGKYKIRVYSDSNEAKLVKQLEIKSQKPKFVKFVEENGGSYILFERIDGVSIDTWLNQKQLIEDILNLSVDIEEYDESHLMWKKFGNKKLILIKESNISLLPYKLGLKGKFLKKVEKSGIIDYFYKDVEDIQSWIESLPGILEFIGEEREIVDQDNGVIILSRPKLPSLNDNVISIHTKDIVKNDQLFLGVKDRNGFNKVYTDINTQTKNKLSGSILVSGVSGSGKSFTINNILRQYVYNYEFVDEIIIFNFKSDAAFDWLKSFKKVKIIDGNLSSQSILKAFMQLQLKMNMKYAYLKEFGEGNKQNFLENFNSLIVVDEAQTIVNKIENARGLELEIYTKIELILQDIASKIRATADSLLISTQLPKLSTIPGGVQVRDNLRHKFCGKGSYNDVSDSIPDKILSENHIVPEMLELGQMLYYDNLTGRFEPVFVQENILTSEDENKIKNYVETEYNLHLLKKFDSLKEIAIRADKLQQEINFKSKMFTNLEEMEDFEEIDVFELAKKQIDEGIDNPSTSIEINTTNENNVEELSDSHYKSSFSINSFEDDNEKNTSINENNYQEDDSIENEIFIIQSQAKEKAKEIFKNL